MQTEASLLAALDALQAHVALVDADGVIVAVNEPWRQFAASNGYGDPNAGIGVNYIDLCEAGAGRDAGLKRIAAALRSILGGELRHFEFEYPCHGPNEKRWFRLQIGGYTGGDGRPAAVLTHENITSLKLSEQRIGAQRDDVQAELDRARAELVKHTRLVTIGQVAASIAHELRNPLGAIRNAAYILRRTLTGADEATARYLRIIEEEVATSDQIIGDLTEMARGRPSSKQAVLARKLVDDVLKRVPKAGSVSVSIAPDDDAELWVDPGQFAQVLGNLIANAVAACEHAEREPLVKVSVSSEPDASVVRVEDAGDGVPEELRERIFEPLFSTRRKGTGLGLAICKQIVERHGGSIRVDPEPSSLGGASLVVGLPAPRRPKE